MLISRLKARNQLTIPNQIVEALNLRLDQLFRVEIDGRSIKLVPVELEPRSERR